MNLVADKKIENLSSDLSTKIIEVEFSSEINTDLLSTHKAISAINSVGNGRFELSCTDDIRKDIFEIEKNG